jgi:hypothetical protein
MAFFRTGMAFVQELPAFTRIGLRFFWLTAAFFPVSMGVSEVGTAFCPRFSSLSAPCHPLAPPIMIRIRTAPAPFHGDAPARAALRLFLRLHLPLVRRFLRRFHPPLLPRPETKLKMQQQTQRFPGGDGLWPLHQLSPPVH